MKALSTIVAGSREITNPEVVYQAIDSAPWGVFELYSGGARGVDAIGVDWAKSTMTPVCIYPADWRTYGKAAGPLRNEQMAKEAEALILIWYGDSPGSANMLMLAKRYKLLIHEVVLPRVPMPPGVGYPYFRIS